MYLESSDTKPYALSFPKKGLEYDYFIKFNYSIHYQFVNITVQGGTINGNQSIIYTFVDTGTTKIIPFKIKWDSQSSISPEIKVYALVTLNHSVDYLNDTFISWQDDLPICTSCPKHEYP